MYEIKFTTQFKKYVKLVKKQNKNLDLMFDIIEKLANGEKIDKKYRDHSLYGNYKGVRECHLEPDLLLLYQYKEEILVLLLTILGSHSEIFNK
nr:type II toxin-antitoxin system YafQ family toxin [Streptobacillus canis]